MRKLRNNCRRPIVLSDMGLGCIATLVTLSKLQGATVTDAEIDRRIVQISTESRISGALVAVYDANPDRVVWNYKRANGMLRSRIVSSVFYNRNSYAEILALAVKEKDFRLRSYAAELLAIVNQGPGVKRRNELLIPLLRDRSALIRQIAAKGARFGLPESPKYLVPMFKDKEPAVRISAAVSLIDRKDVRAIPILVSFLGHSDKYSHVLEQSGSGSQLESVLAHWGVAVISQVEPKLSSRDAAVRSSALIVLTLTNQQKAYEYGMRMVVDKDPMVRIRAYNAIGWDKRPEAIPILLKGMSDHEKVKGGNTWVSMNVASALQGQSNPRSHGWPEGEAALKKWYQEHPNEY